MASGTKRQLCAVLVLRRRGSRIRQSGTVEFGICVLIAMECPQNKKIENCHSTKQKTENEYKKNFFGN